MRRKNKCINYTNELARSKIRTQDLVTVRGNLKKIKNKKSGK